MSEPPPDAQYGTTAAWNTEQGTPFTEDADTVEVHVHNIQSRVKIPGDSLGGKWGGDAWELWASTEAGYSIFCWK